MDGDDISDANRFYIQTDYLCSHKEIDILGGSMDIVDHNGKLVSHRSYPLKGFRLIFMDYIEKSARASNCYVPKEIS